MFRQRLLRFVGLLAYAFAFAAPLLYARAGGGGHYSGGGGHSSGGGYSSGGGSSGGGADVGYLVYLYFRFVFANPLVGVPVTALLVYIAYKVLSNSDVMLASDGRMRDTISRGSEVQERRRLDENLARLKVRDPDFEADQFLARAKGAFLAIQKAWSEQNMASARAFISDGVMERFAIQLELQKADGKKNVMEGVSVEEAEALEIESDAFFDTLHVRIEASAVDKEVALSDGRLLFGSNEPEEFAEVWSFVRRPGAKTLKKPGLLEGFCPSCGAPLPIADAALCASCKSWVNSGEYDWVLCEITQEEEWAVRGSGAEVPGFSELSQRDSALSTQFLEDRASVAFWRWQWAFAQKNPALMRSVAADEFCKALAVDGSSYRDAAVGTVEVQAFETAGDVDRAHVMVKWSGEHIEGSGTSAVSHGQVLRQHVVVFARKTGLKTDARSGLRSSRCAKCGAPSERRDQAQCQFCGAPFNDGSLQWTVVELAPIGLWKKPPAAGAPVFDADWARELSPVDGLALLVAAMSADGRIDDKETALLADFARSRGVRPETVGATILAAQEGHLDIPKPSGAAQARACLRGLAQMALADGSVTDDEIRFMTAFGQPFGLTESDVSAVVKEERASLYRQAKKGLKGAPSS
ncbi:MAG: TIM44-like domain-containing protein [Elusimicrobia bacterium]|nr:TIM44-like domain-containing protein [Elusimicrobiota bacterium]